MILNRNTSNHEIVSKLLVSTRIGWKVHWLTKMLSWNVIYFSTWSSVRSTRFFHRCCSLFGIPLVKKSSSSDLYRFSSPPSYLMHVHIGIYIYIYICVCVCVCVCWKKNPILEFQTFFSFIRDFSINIFLPFSSCFRHVLD